MDKMAEQGVLEALAEAVKANPNNTALLSAVAQCFNKFAAYKPEYAQQIMNTGAMEMLIKALNANTHVRGGAINILPGCFVGHVAVIYYFIPFHNRHDLFFVV